ncbi:HNH endonuclease signature motif containing protein [Ensifer sp. 2YAB10]|uniref:HNH endonuclease signature motif containing protein n=1 Tax=unclassified Ensifer TaxID=2633371 RepID=UPI003F919FD0
MHRKSYPARDRLAALFDYCPVTGVLTWKVRPIEDFPSVRTWRMWNSRFAGEPAGHLSDTGYLVVTLDGDVYKAHLIAWVLYHGSMPGGDVDHISGERSDNRADNMRAVNRSQNMRNAARPKRNTSGFVGVSWHKRTKKWNAAIRDRNGRRRSLGYFDDVNEAAAVRKSAEVSCGYHPNHGRCPNHGMFA